MHLVLTLSYEAFLNTAVHTNIHSTMGWYNYKLIILIVINKETLIC